jgi:hypothetical protein
LWHRAAEHSGLGVYNNQIVDNVADGNGLGTPSAPDASAGRGIILARTCPGSNYNGNLILGNKIGTNNLRQDFADPDTTGI